MAKAKPKNGGVLRKGVLMWGTVLVFVGGWLFFLGVLVGRGLVPMPFEADSLESEIAAQRAEETALAQARLRQGAQEGLPDEPLRIQALRKAQVDTEVRPILPESVVGPDGQRLKKRRVPPKKRPLAKVVRPAPVAGDQRAADAPSAPQTRQADGAAGKAVNPAASTPADGVAAALAGMQAKCTLQVASVREQAAAERIVKHLQKAGHPAYQTASRPGSNGVWYRVRVGAYQSRKAAEAALSQFKDSRYKPIVIQR